MKLYYEERQGATKEKLILDRLFKVNEGRRNRLPAIDQGKKNKNKKSKSY